MLKVKFVAAILVAILVVCAVASPTSAAETEYRIANMFDPQSTPALKIHEISLMTLGITGAIFLVVTVILFYTVFKFRRRSADDDLHEPPQVYGSSQIEMAWTVIPIIITVVLILISARTIGEIQDAEIPDDALRIRLVGHQWWWEIHYVDKEGNTLFTTANEIHVPVAKPGEPGKIEILLESADVIHSFWVPQLAGKTDLVPNRTNRTWIEPTRVGIYLGNCAEYCGTQHANMQLRVFVMEPEAFEAWAANQQTPPPMDPAVAKGRDLFVSTACINCHTVDGTVADGVFGPDLSKFATRQTLGAGVALNDTKNLTQWVRDPQVLKPGCLMPDMKLEDSEVTEIVAYLQTLK